MFISRASDKGFTYVNHGSGEVRWISFDINGNYLNHFDKDNALVSCIGGSL